MNSPSRFLSKGLKKVIVVWVSGMGPLIVISVDSFVIGRNEIFEFWLLSIEEIIEDFTSQRGKQFDPNLVDIFLENINEFRTILEANREDIVTCTDENGKELKN